MNGMGQRGGQDVVEMIEEGGEEGRRGGGWGGKGC